MDFSFFTATVTSVLSFTGFFIRVNNDNLRPLLFSTAGMTTASLLTENKRVEDEGSLDRTIAFPTDDHDDATPKNTLDINNKTVQKTKCSLPDAMIGL